MIRLMTAAALTLFVAGHAAPVLASTDLDEATRTKITEQLTAEGYEVRKIDSEDGMIEVYALKDGKKLELYLDAELKVVKTKNSDD